MRQIIGLSALLILPPTYARDCAAPPVRDSEQAACYATAYAEKKGLPYGPSFRKKVAKGRTTWNVRYEDTRADTRGAGWEVDVDPATGTVTRFKSYKSATGRP
jgi:hypothetical protein